MLPWSFADKLPKGAYGPLKQINNRLLIYKE